MQLVRQWHLYLSCLFSPVLIYFSLSGAWQTFRFNDIPRDSTPTKWQRLFHELSKPHKEGTPPGYDTKKVHSDWFNAFSLSMGLGIAATSLLGILLALQMTRRRAVALVLLVVGTVVPVVFLYFCMTGD